MPNKIDTNKIVFHSSLAGLQNYNEVSFSASIPSQSVPAGNFRTARAQTPLNNANAVGQVQVQFGGLEAFTRLVPGVVIVDYPNASAPSYEIQCLTYFTGGNLIVDCYIINQTGGAVTIPAVTFNCRAFLYLAPF